MRTRAPHGPARDVATFTRWRLNAKPGVLGVSRTVHRGRSQAGHGLILRGFVRRLALCGPWRHPRYVDDEEQGIFRGEVTTMMWKLADIDVNVWKSS